ncbi:hypothetical protein [Nonomuraea dietziae]|uniref:hypothetical protein n=1 Tax=Nonomuraea dietziae TaxID=65515 RepID=UPI0031DBDCCD
MDGLTESEQERLARLEHWQQEQSGYDKLQGTRPQTLGHGLNDSPAGQLAWIVEKFKEWTDSAADLPEDAVNRDAILTDVSIYWFTQTGASSAHHYYEAHTRPLGLGATRTRDRAHRRSGLPHPGRRHPSLRRTRSQRRALDRIRARWTFPGHGTARARSSPTCASSSAPCADRPYRRLTPVAAVRENSGPSDLR